MSSKIQRTGQALRIQVKETDAEFSPRHQRLTTCHDLQLIQYIDWAHERRISRF